MQTKFRMSIESSHSSRTWILFLSILLLFECIMWTCAEDAVAVVENIRITYTERDAGVSVDWFGLTMFETPEELSAGAVRAVLRGVSQFAEDEMKKVYDANSGYDLDSVTLGNVTEVEFVRQQSRQLKRIFELDTHASSRDTIDQEDDDDDENSNKVSIRQVSSSFEEDERQVEYRKKTRQVLEDVFGSFFILSGNVTFTQLPTPPPEEVNDHLSTILDKISTLKLYIKNQNHPELFQVNTLIIQKDMPSSAPSNTPTSIPSSSPTPAPTHSPTAVPTPPPTDTPVTSSPTPVTSNSETPSPTPVTSNSVTPPASSLGPTPSPTSSVNQQIKNNPQPDDDKKQSVPIIATVASVSAAFVILASAYLVRQRNLEKFSKVDKSYEKQLSPNVSGSSDDSMFFGSKKTEKSFDPNDQPTPKASGNSRFNNGLAASNSGSFEYSSGMQLHEADLNYYQQQQRGQSTFELHSIENGVYSPPVSEPKTPASVRDTNFENVDPFDSNTQRQKMVGIASSGDGVEVAAVPFGVNSPSLMGNWGNWLFGAAKSQQSKASPQPPPNEQGAFPSSSKSSRNNNYNNTIVEEDNFETEYDMSPKQSRSNNMFMKRLEPKPAGTSESPRSNLAYSTPYFDAKSAVSSSQDSPASTRSVDGSFPTFNTDGNTPSQRTMRANPRVYREDNYSNGNNSSSNGGLHPMDWSYKGSEGDTSTSTPQNDNRHNRQKGPRQQMIQNLPVTPQSRDSSYYSFPSEAESSEKSEASSSKQLINDLVWLEKKISDVRSRVNQLDGEDGTGNDSSLEIMSQSSTQSSTDYVIKSPVSHSIICRDCFAPPGRLQIVIHSTKDGPAVHSVKPGSALEGQIFPGDLILAVDDLDTRSYSAEEVMKMMAAKSAFERKITVLHFDDESFQL